MFYIRKEALSEMVLGYEKFILLKLNIKYQNMKDKEIQYLSNYRITRLLTSQVDKYEVSIQESHLEPSDIFSYGK